MFDDARGLFEDRALAGSRLGAVVGARHDVGEAIVVALGSGGWDVARALAEPGQPVHGVDTFAAVAGLPDAVGLTVIVVDDGERPTEELAAAVWAVKSTRPERLVVAVPVASRWLEAALPAGTEVVTLRRYTPVRDEPLVYTEDGRRFEGEMSRRDYPRAPRNGRPWDSEEEARLEALVRDGTPLAEIATALGRTRGGISARIAHRAIRRGVPSAPP